MESATVDIDTDVSLSTTTEKNNNNKKNNQTNKQKKQMLKRSTFPILTLYRPSSQPPPLPNKPSRTFE